MPSPTQLTLKHLRTQGYSAAIVEKTIPYSFIKVDLFGCIDIVAVHPLRPGVLGVQTTTAVNQTTRLHKARTCPDLTVWLQAGNRFEVHGWVKKAEGKRKVWVANVLTFDGIK